MRIECKCEREYFERFRRKYNNFSLLGSGYTQAHRINKALTPVYIHFDFVNWDEVVGHDPRSEAATKAVPMMGHK